MSTPDDPRHQHSRAGAASGHSARSGAGQVRAEDLAAAAREAAAANPTGADTPAQGAATPEELQRQAFANSGHLTGRPVAPQDAAAAYGAGGAPAPGAPGAPGAPVPGAAPGAPGAIPMQPDPNGEWVPREAYETLATQMAEATDTMQRLAADFDNYRKRAAREQQAAAAAADQKLLGELLDVLDDFDRALGAGADAAALADGIRMVHGRLSGVLNQHGLQVIDTAGAFDPHLHEALMAQPAEGREEGDIVSVVQKGYTLGDRVLRHAKVIVAQ